MGKKFQSFLGDLLVALDAVSERAGLYTFEGRLDLLGFLQALNAQTFEYFVARDFCRALLEIGFGAVLFQIAVDFGQS